MRICKLLINSERRMAISYFALVLLAVLLFTLSQGADINWDLRNYHFYNGYAIHHDRFLTDWRPSFIGSNINSPLDRYYYLLISSFKPQHFALILSSFQFINLILIFYISKYILTSTVFSNSRLLLYLSSLVGFISASNTGQLGGTMSDNIISVLILSSILLILLFLKSTKLMLVTFFSGLLIGLAVALKLTNSIYALSIAVGLFMVVTKRFINLKIPLIYVTGCLAGFIAGAGSWIWRGITVYGNPLFPFFNGIFKSNYAIEANFRDSRFFPQSVIEFVFYPFIFLFNPQRVSEVSFTDLRIPLTYLMYIILLVIFIYIHTKKLIKRTNTKQYRHQLLNFTFLNAQVFLVIFWILSYIIWLVAFSIYRYAIILEFLSPLIIIVISSMIVKNVRNNISINSIIFFLSALLFLVLMTTKPMMWERIKWNSNYFTIKYDNISVNLQDSTLLMYGYNPYAFIIPLLPESMNAVRIHPVETESQERLVRTLIKDNTYILRENSDNSEKINDLLNLFGLKITESECFPIRTNMNEENLIPEFSFCKVEKFKT